MSVVDIYSLNKNLEDRRNRDNYIEMFACKCLNILIHTENNDIQKVDIVDLESLQLSDGDKNDDFFKKEIGRVMLENISKEQAGLVSTRTVGPWIIHKCLNCSMDTHAIHKERGANSVLIAVHNLLSGTSNISSLRNSENYSSAFRVLINSNSDSDEETDLSTVTVSQLAPNLQLAMNSLQQQLADVLRREVTATEERIRRYSEMQYSALDAFREEAHREHHVLVRLVLNSQPVEENIKMDTSNASLSTSQAVLGTDESPMKTSNPRQSSVSKPKHPIVTNLTKTKRPVSRQLSQPMQRLESLDAEGLFPLEGMDESPVLTHSDVEESDTDDFTDSASHDEGIHIPRQRAQSMSVAKSLPMTIPVFMSAFTHDIIEDKHEMKAKEDSVDIAASIKALAKSVHGDAVFGDLPRPRFSTQI